MEPFHQEYTIAVILQVILSVALVSAHHGIPKNHLTVLMQYKSARTKDIAVKYLHMVVILALFADMRMAKKEVNWPIMDRLLAGNVKVSFINKYTLFYYWFRNNNILSREYNSFFHSNNY